ncbi:MAG: hypothetical protein ACSHXF_09570 [Aquaticitalea sp.]
MTKVVKSKVKGEFEGLAEKFKQNNQIALNAIKETKKLPNRRQELKTETAEKAVPKKPFNEDGNANNVFNFDLEIAVVAELGTLFAPSNTLLQLVHLNQVLQDAMQSMADVNTMFNTLKRLLDQRQELYNRMLKTATRMMGELRSCGASKKTIKKAASYNNKIQGRKIKKVDPNSTDKEISSAQTSFAQRFNHFDGLIGVCELEPLYSPSAEDLTIVELRAFLLALKDINSEVAKAKSKLTKARTRRNKILYNPITGMVDIAIAVKEYVKAVFGFSSPEYREVRHIKFKNLIKL